jgi:hypothetical protein
MFHASLIHHPLSKDHTASLPYTRKGFYPSHPPSHQPYVLYAHAQHHLNLSQKKLQMLHSLALNIMYMKRVLMKTVP